MLSQGAVLDLCNVSYPLTVRRQSSGGSAASQSGPTLPCLRVTLAVGRCFPLQQPDLHVTLLGDPFTSVEM